jgi:hypothetical protein
VLSFFNVTPSAEEMKTIEQTIGLYAKEVSATRPFVADSEIKKQTASELVRKMAARWASEPYHQLEQKRLQQS